MVYTKKNRWLRRQRSHISRTVSNKRVIIEDTFPMKWTRETLEPDEILTQYVNGSKMEGQSTYYIYFPINIQIKWLKNKPLGAHKPNWLLIIIKISSTDSYYRKF